MIEPPDPGNGNATALSPESWARVRGLVDEALTFPSEARPAFLNARCGDDALRDRVARLAAACDRAEGNWGFLAHSAGELAAPLLRADEAVMGDPTSANWPPAAFRTALADRYAVGAELGRGGMATVYVAEDVRHHRRVALKVLDPHLGAMLGAERFLTEIRVTAGLQQPNLVPLFDSGEAGGLLYYVMPLIDGATLRARLQRERQLPVNEAIGIVRTIAVALDYAHRQDVVHRDLKPENILLQDGQPLVADFGISLAVTNAADSRLTAAVKSLGTPQYMSPEQITGASAVDGRSDIYSLACVLYELLVGEPPFTGSTVQAVVARVLGERPSGVRTRRPTVPAHVEAAIARALSKLPADRHATAREFADALILAPAATAAPARWRDPIRLLLGAGVICGLAGAAWIALNIPSVPLEITQIPYRNLIDQALGSGVNITPDGRALVYTGSADAGRPLMLWRLDQRAARAIPGTEGGAAPFVAPDGQQLSFLSRDGVPETILLAGVAATDRSHSWRYGTGRWLGDSMIVMAGGSGGGSVGRGLSKGALGEGTWTWFTQPDTARGESLHMAPLVLPGGRAVVFTVSMVIGPRLRSGPLAIASIDPGTESSSPHVSLGVTARRAIAYVDGWLLYTRADGKAIMAVRLDVARSRIVGSPILALEDDGGDLETGSLADNGTLLYVRRPRANSAVLVAASGAAGPGLANSEGPFMNPRLAPDGKRFAVQVNSAKGEDVWLYDIASRSATQLTTTGKALHPTWTPDGRHIVFMQSGRRGLVSQPVDGHAAADTLMGTEGAFAPTVTPDGNTVLYQRLNASLSGWSIWSASLSGGDAPRRLLDDSSSSYMPAVSPDGRWLAYTSTATGKPEVYARPFPGVGPVVQVSDSGGTEPAWSPDGNRIYYRARGTLMAVDLASSGLTITSRRQLFKDPFDATMPHRNYDVAPSGTEFLMIAPSTTGSPEAVVVLNWLTRFREQIAHGH